LKEASLVNRVVTILEGKFSGELAQVVIRRDGELLLKLSNGVGVWVHEQDVRRDDE
jgi:hypothetical protein